MASFVCTSNKKPVLKFLECFMGAIERKLLLSTTSNNSFYYPNIQIIFLFQFTS